MIGDRLSAEEVRRLAAALTTARETRRPIPPLTAGLPELAVEDAYAIARLGVSARTAVGARVVGHKIGLTSQAVQLQLGVSQPDYGALLDAMEIADGTTVDASDYIAPRVELELAFHVSERLSGPDVTPADVRRSADWVQPAIELVDSRIRDWRIGLADTIADNASSAGFVLGGRRCPLNELDTSGVEVELWRGSRVEERGRSDAVLGDPCFAVAWLANALAPFGAALEPGQIVLSGACTRMVAAVPGDVFRGTFGELGEVSVSFAAEAADRRGP